MSHSRNSTPYMPRTPSLTPPVDIPHLVHPDLPPPPPLITVLQEGMMRPFNYGALEAMEHLAMVIRLTQIYGVQPETIHALMRPHDNETEESPMETLTNPSPEPLPIPPRDRSLPPYSRGPSPLHLLDAISELMFPDATSNPTAATTAVLARPPTSHPANRDIPKLTLPEGAPISEVEVEALLELTEDGESGELVEVRLDRSWFHNDGDNYYEIQAPYQDTMREAWFIWVENHNTGQARIAATQGQGCPITFTPLVDQALQEEHNFSLLAKVQAFRNARRQTKKHAAELALACRKMHRALEDKFLSIEKLSAANAHRQIEPHVSYDTTPEHAHISPEAFAKASNDFNNPWFEGPTPGPYESSCNVITFNTAKCAEDPVMTSGTAINPTLSVSPTKSAMLRLTIPGNTSDIATLPYAPTALET
ncbi:hypothetical protein BC827DRAFT_1158703 [Russula dissimulans]|nr:hypothetical protein BC827DRAFT_1158703 [Russula dissimulans]